MLSMLVLIIKWLLVILIIIALLGLLFLKFAPTFGGKPDPHSQARIKSSPNFDGKTFVNLTPTQASTVNFSTITEKETSDSEQNGNFLWKFIFPPKGKNPTKPITTIPLDLIEPETSANKHSTASNADSVNTRLNNGEFVWLGHSTVLFRTADKTILTDPVFHRASPLPVGVKPFAMTHAPAAADLPFIDVVLISHDHYDHLDHKAIKQLKDKVGHFYVPLGVKAHLMRWGVAAANISEFDWYEEAVIGDESAELVSVTFTPTRHFSGRGITNHRTSLWGSWAVQSPNLKVYFSGDGGYSDEFAKIGARFGGFDIAFIEDGAYNARWQDVHMLPEQSAQAGIDVGAKVVLPIHWGKFDLSTHHWREPVMRIKDAINQHNKNSTVDKHVTITTPRIGEVFTLQNLPDAPWWEQE